MSKYFVRQEVTTLRWQVVTIDEDQAESMEERGETTYDSPKQAHAIADERNDKQTRQRSLRTICFTGRD